MKQGAIQIIYFASLREGFVRRLSCACFLGRRLGFSLVPGGICMQFVLWKLYFGLRTLAKQQEGQDLVEYGLIMMLISTGAFVCVGGVAGKIVNMYNYINTNYV